MLHIKLLSDFAVCFFQFRSIGRRSLLRKPCADKFDALHSSLGTRRELTSHDIFRKISLSKGLLRPWHIFITERFILITLLWQNESLGRIFHVIIAAAVTSNMWPRKCKCDRRQWRMVIRSTYTDTHTMHPAIAHLVQCRMPCCSDTIGNCFVMLLRSLRIVIGHKIPPA